MNTEYVVNKFRPAYGIQTEHATRTAGKTTRIGRIYPSIMFTYYLVLNDSVGSLGSLLEDTNILSGKVT